MGNLMERWGQGLALSANLDHIKTSTMSNKRIEHSCSRLFFKQYPYTNGGFVISDILHFFMSSQKLMLFPLSSFKRHLKWRETHVWYIQYSIKDNDVWICWRILQVLGLFGKDNFLFFQKKKKKKILPR